MKNTSNDSDPLRITAEDLRRMIDDVIKTMPPPEITDMWSGAFYPRTLASVPILENEHIQDLEPVIQLSSKVNVSPEFRKKCNAWYIEMFGYKQPVIYKTQFGFIMGKNMHSLLTGDFTA